MRDVRVRLAPPAPRFVASLLACCAGKRLRVSSAPHPCGFESHEMGPNKNGPLSRTVSNSMVGDEGCRVRLAPPASASSLRSSRGALENASRFLSFAPCRVRIPLRWVQKRKAPIAGSLSNQWWAMRDVRVRLRRPHPLRRFAPRVLRWKTLRVSSAPHPCGFESHEMGPNKNGPLSRTVSNSMVGDEGFEPPALCV